MLHAPPHSLHAFGPLGSSARPASRRRRPPRRRAITVLEYDWATSLDFGGIQTSEAEAGLSRAAKGGMLSAEQLRAVVTLVNGTALGRAAAVPTGHGRV
jgi:hypothetical protein